MWTWAAASVRGTSHERTGTRRQDAFRCTVVNGGKTLIGITCDGAGSASHGGEGASLAARVLSTLAEAYMREAAELPSDDAVWEWIDDVRDRLIVAAHRRLLTPRDFATTVVMVIALPGQSLTIHIGDGAAVGRTACDHKWIPLGWPEHGEFASATYFITDEAQVRARLLRSQETLDRVALMTDGIERLALDLTNSVPHAPFFSGISEPVAQSAATGLDHKLSATLARYLNSDTINQRTDDDKSLIVATWR